MLALFAVLCVGMMIIPAYAESSPREQLRDGIPINQIQCGEEKTLIQSTAGRPACVFDPTLERLLVRGWSIIPVVQPTPEPQVVSGTAPDQLVEEYSPEDDIIYLLADDHITTRYAPKLPDPDAVWFPMSLADAEIVLKRLLDAYDDRIVFYEQPNNPCHTFGGCRVPNSTGIFQPSLEFSGRYFYATEKGGEVTFIKKYASRGTSIDIDSPHVISKMSYTIPERIPYDQREEFITSFMDKAGFYNSEVTTDLIDEFTIHGGMRSIYAFDSISFSAKKAGTLMSFSGWTNNAESLGQLFLNGAELERRAHEFARKHMHLIKPEFCETFREEPLAGYLSITVMSAGTILADTRVGKCINSDGRTNSINVTIEALEGKIAFFTSPRNLVEDWYEKIDIPEYTLTHLQPKIQKQLGAAKPISTVNPISTVEPIMETSADGLFESYYHENGNLIDENWYYENGNPKTQKKYNLFGNGNLEQETHYYDGDHGFIKSDKRWNEDGQLSSEKQWHENGKTKFQRNWYDNGELSSGTSFVYDENWIAQSSLHRIYHDNGKLNIESKHVKSKNHDGTLPKYYSHYYATGKLAYEIHYDDHGKKIR